MTDQSLLAKYVHTKDHEAFKVLVLRYQGLVYAACKRYLNSNADVEDAFQQVFLALMENAQAVNTNLGGWLHRCATHKAISMVRSDVARKRREAARAVEDSCDDRRVVWNEVRDIIDECLNDLRPLDKEVVIQHVLLQNSQADIARSMGVSQQAIAKRASKAIALLRAGLRGKGVVVSAVALMITLQEHAVAATVPAKLTAVLMHTTTKWTVATGVTALTAAGGGITATTNLKVAAVVAVTALIVMAPSDQESPGSRAGGLTGTAAVEVLPAGTAIASATPQGGSMSRPFDSFGLPNAYGGVAPRSYAYQSNRAQPSVLNPQINPQSGLFAKTTVAQTNLSSSSGGPIFIGPANESIPAQNNGLVAEYHTPREFAVFSVSASTVLKHGEGSDQWLDGEYELAPGDQGLPVVVGYDDDANTSHLMEWMDNYIASGADEADIDRAMGETTRLGEEILQISWGAGDFDSLYYDRRTILTDYLDYWYESPSYEWFAQSTMYTDYDWADVDSDPYDDMYYDNDADWADDYSDPYDGMYYDDNDWVDDYPLDDFTPSWEDNYSDPYNDTYYDDDADWADDYSDPYDDIYYDDADWVDGYPLDEFTPSWEDVDFSEFDQELNDLMLYEQLIVERISSLKNAFSGDNNDERLEELLLEAILLEQDINEFLDYEQELADLMLYDQWASEAYRKTFREELAMMSTGDVLNDEFLSDDMPTQSPDETLGRGMDAGMGKSRMSPNASSSRRPSLAVAPEPSTVGLLGIGAAALLPRRK